VAVDGVWIAIGCSDHLYTKHMTADNYSAIVNSHILQFTAPRTKSSQSIVFSSRCLVTAFDGGRPCYSGFSTIPVAEVPASDSDDLQGLNRSCPHSVTNSLLTSLN
jgi:hypothetical protein